MDETTKNLIEKITVKYNDAREIPSGHLCSIYYDCNQLSPNDLARLGAEAVGHLDAHYFDLAVGIAYNGIFFSAAIAGGRLCGILQKDGKFSGPPIKGKKVVVVDDVVHSGTRLSEAAAKLSALGANIVGYACIVDRSNGNFGSEERPLWSAYQTDMS